MDGNGTINNPYLINSIADLKSTENVNNIGTDKVYYKQMVDLDFTDEIETFYSLNYFNVDYNGNNKIIKGLHKIINRSTPIVGSNISVGIWGRLRDSKVYNLNIIDYDLNTNDTINYVGNRFYNLAYVGGLVGYCENSNLDNVAFYGNIVNYKNVTMSMGGLVGSLENGTFTNCIYRGRLISVGDLFVGGLVGELVSKRTNDNFISCYSIADIECNNYNSYVGGFIGLGSIPMNYSVYKGSIKINDYNINGNVSIGGAFGFGASKLNNCGIHANITTNTDGDICGLYNSENVESVNCYCELNVYSTINRNWSNYRGNCLIGSGCYSKIFINGISIVDYITGIAYNINLVEDNNYGSFIISDNSKLFLGRTLEESKVYEWFSRYRGRISYNYYLNNFIIPNGFILQKNNSYTYVKYTNNVGYEVSIYNNYRAVYFDSKIVKYNKTFVIEGTDETLIDYYGQNKNIRLTFDNKINVIKDGIVQGVEVGDFIKSIVKIYYEIGVIEPYYTYHEVYLKVTESDESGVNADIVYYLSEEDSALSNEERTNFIPNNKYWGLLEYVENTDMIISNTYVIIDDSVYFNYLKENIEPELDFINKWTFIKESGYEYPLLQGIDYSKIFDIVNGFVYVQSNNKIIQLGLYSVGNIGVEYTNGIKYLQIVDVDSPKASPVRISLGNGIIKAISY